MLAATFSALRDSRFLTYFAGQTLSNTGTWMERAAVAALVYSLTDHDERWLALVAVLPAVPALLLSVPAGALVDRTNVRRLIRFTQATMLVLALLLALLASSGLVRPWHLALYTLLASSVFAVDAPARQSFVPRIVHREDLTNALALSTVTFNVARLAGGIAFWIVMTSTTWGEPGCFWLNAGSFLFMLVALQSIRENPRPAISTAHETHGLLQGLRFAARTPVVRAASLLVLITSLLGFQVSHLIPVYAEKVWHEGKAGQGTLHASIGVGALGGGLFLAAMSRRLRRGRHVVTTAFLGAVALIAGASAESFGLGCALFAVAGFLLIQTHTGCNALMQSEVPDGLRGRVVALYTMCVLGAFPVGGFAAALVAGEIGARRTTTGAAGLLALAVVALASTHRELLDAD